MRYVMFAFVTLLLQVNVSMSQNAPPIGLPEGNPAAVTHLASSDGLSCSI